MFRRRKHHHHLSGYLFGTGCGSCQCHVQSLGEKDQDNIAYHATESLKVTLLLSALLGGASLLFGRQMISLLGTEAAVAESGGIYLSLVGGTIVLLGLMTTLGSLVRVANNPRIPMYVSLLTNLLNALFSSVAIFLFGWGIVGAALGTVLARLVGSHPLVAKGSATLCTPSLGIGS